MPLLPCIRFTNSKYKAQVKFSLVALGETCMIMTLNHKKSEEYRTKSSTNKISFVIFDVSLLAHKTIFNLKVLYINKN